MTRVSMIAACAVAAGVVVAALIFVRSPSQISSTDTFEAAGLGPVTIEEA